MRINTKHLFPESLSDEAASALCAFLYALADACESRYLAQLLRHQDAQQTLYDPEHPWRFRPTDR